MNQGSRLVPLGWERASAIQRKCRRFGGVLTLVVALTVGILGGQSPSGAQQAAKVPRIGVLFSGAPATSSHAAAAFEQGMRDRGYREGDIVKSERGREGSGQRQARAARRDAARSA
jgi:hypothetical protein